jgi:hypothetical protein
MKIVHGKIAAYGIQDWWFSTFSEKEREYIDNRYQPMGLPLHSLTQGNFGEQQHPAPEFLNELNSWFRSTNNESISDRIHKKLIEITKDNPINLPGYFNGRHFTTYIRDFEILKKSGNNNELERLLLELVNATEAENAVDGYGVAPAYYSELAILYRKQKDYSKEVSILERFAKQKHANGVMPGKLAERLEKAKILQVSNPI